MTFPTYSGEIPYLTTEQMIEVDRAMIENYRIDLIQMMENAGRNLAHLARTRFFDGDPRDKVVMVLAGTGGNGGGALVCARRLSNFGAAVSVYTTKPIENIKSVPAHQLDILRRMGVPVGAASELKQSVQPDLIIDGIIGYSLKGAPRGTAADMIRWANSQAAPVLALDAPSGIDTSTGTVFEPSISANATMTLALPKEGLRAAGVLDYVGELYLADISVPPQLYKSLGLDVAPIFAESEIIRLR